MQWGAVSNPKASRVWHKAHLSLQSPTFWSQTFQPPAPASAQSSQDVFAWGAGTADSAARQSALTKGQGTAGAVQLAIMCEQLGSFKVCHLGQTLDSYDTLQP